MPEKNTALVQSWLPPDLASLLRQRAAASDRSVSSQVRQLLRAALESESPGQGASAQNAHGGCAHVQV